MGRVAKDGLDYFPVDVDIFEDDKMLLAQELIDPDGKETFFRFCVPYIAIRLLREIYKRGYYIAWDDKVCRIHANQIGNGITMNVLKNIINTLMIVGFFDSDKYSSFGILTSHGIQKRWLLIKNLCRSTVLPINKDYILIDLKSKIKPAKNKLQKKVIVQESGITVQEKALTVARKPIVYTNLCKDKAFPFSLSNNKSIEYKGISSLKEYSTIISNYIEKKEKRGITAQEKGIDVQLKGITAQEKGIDVQLKGITEQEKGIDVQLKGITAQEKESIWKIPEKKQIKFDAVDLQNLANTGEEFKENWLVWINYLFFEHDKILKSGQAKRFAIEELSRIANYDEAVAVKIIKKSISNGWKQFFPLKDDDSQLVIKGTGIKKQVNKRQPEPAKDAPPEEWEAWYYGNKKRG